MSLLSLEDVAKRYRCGARELVVFDRVSLEVEPGDLVGVWGERRSGKSTLLRLAAGIERPDSGIVRFAGRDIATMSADERAALLLRDIGLVSTSLELGGMRSARSEAVVDLVAIPLIFDGHSRTEATAAARHALAMCGAADCAHAAPRELKPGERTRVALARALIREPRLLLVDEPAVTQSPSERDAIRDLLHQVTREVPVTTIVASEDVKMLAGAPRVVSVGDGQMASSQRLGTVVPFPRTAS
jgi:predicted ABC-type transport system involved in lysophospholipase L1 biosynthesis ATPase subunit